MLYYLVLWRLEATLVVVSSLVGVFEGVIAQLTILTRHDEVLREPLVRRQGSQVSMRVARGSASWLSSHGRGLGPRDGQGSQAVGTGPLESRRGRQTP